MSETGHPLIMPLLDRYRAVLGLKYLTAQVHGGKSGPEIFEGMSIPRILAEIR